MEETDPWVALRANLKALFAAVKDGTRHGPATPLELEAASTVGKSTIYRLLAGARQPISLGHVAALASAYRLPAWALLLPGLDVASEPVGSSAAQIEAMAAQLFKDGLYERRKLKAQDIKGRPGGRYPFVAGAAPKAKPGRRPATSGGKRRRAAARTPAAEKK